MAQIVIQPRDAILQRYGRALDELGSPARSHRVLARAINYEGRRAFVAVKQTLHKQTSIPSGIVAKSMKFVGASTKGGALEAIIVGKGSELSLKRFSPRQFKAGTKATVWGKRQLYPGTFMGPKPGAIATKLGGHVFHREGKARLPIQKSFGPSVPKEMVKDETAAAFYASAPRIVDRVGKEIAAVLRGF